MSATDLLLAGMWGGFACQLAYPPLTQLFCKSNEALVKGQYYRLLTCCFLHGSPVHLLLNSVSLSSVGPEVERWFGKARYVSIVAATGVGGSLLSSRLSPHPSVGASGAVFGLLGAWSIFLAENRDVLERRSTGKSLQSIARTVGLNAAIGFSTPNLDHAGHLGGFGTGLAAGLLIGPRLQVTRRPMDQVLVDRARLPSLLRNARHWLRQDEKEQRTQQWLGYALCALLLP